MSSPLPSRQQDIFRGIALRSAGVAFFALMSAAMKLAGNHGAGPVEMVFFRAAVGIPAILAWLWLTDGVGTIRTKRPGAHIFRSLIGLASLGLLFQSLVLLPLADAVAIGFSAPAFATILSAIFLREHVGLHRWAAVAIGFVGVIVVARPGGSDLPLAGVAIAIAAAFANAAVNVTVREMGATESAGAIIFWFFVSVFVVSAIAMPFFTGRHDAMTWWLLLAGGLTGTGAQLCMTRALQAAPIAALVPFDYAQIVWAALLGWLIWSVVPGASTLAGAALIAASGLYTVWREQRLRRASAATLG
ncbi:MAG: DMT family transporter [Alphaproteobacteria bacterium]